MKSIIGMYTVLVLFMAVTFLSVYVFNDQYSGIATWICLLLFLVGTAFYVNARHYFGKKPQ
ncbi:hypothetical protein AC739_10690 [Planococcus glaciei]|uniref:hypothetical protein n=1 Tax=Planococcus glaciei TaxID=459472 RepID=UPI00069E25FD|nr:hypothetical protein [Planococcus glaciei]KOF10208.1 hypothetical protein AC739_10690 [Planococcus glaciei]MBX0314695.1 hypothetical protein [Planococcus glaciei]